MKRVVLAALAALGTMGASGAGAVPIEINGAGILTSESTKAANQPDRTIAVNIPIAFEIVYDTTGELPFNYPVFGGSGGFFSVSAASDVGLRGAVESTPYISSTASSYDVFNDNPFAGAFLNVSLNVPSPVDPLQGAVSLLPGSTVNLGTFVTFGSTTYSGVVTSFTTAVPEAGTWALMLAGVAAIGAALRRRGRAAPALA